MTQANAVTYILRDKRGHQVSISRSSMPDIELGNVVSKTSLTPHDRRVFILRILKTLQMWSDHPIITDAVCRELDKYDFYDNRERLFVIQSLRAFDDIPQVKDTMEHLKKVGVYRNKEGVVMTFEEFAESEYARVHKEMNKFIVLFVILILLALFTVIFMTQK
ncbi:hypothetical protein L596_025278 [Steinernema carpocapsae]|uniref:Uncharacterized protein n=1 Tax=Steinernema carpocapsae TaxID=34508 RepID=A0A4U5M7B8_STECR|nr:hypothetical protein L596_025278 [Steinernema carpocapsae]